MLVTKRQLSAARRDLAEGIAGWRVWHLLAWQEIRQRYRRSMLGPFWLTISMAVQMLTMGVVVAILFQQSFDRFMPYVCIGLIFWVLVSSLLSEGATAFVSAGSFILHMRIPLTTYVLQCIWRNLIISAHNMVVYVAVALIYGIEPTAHMLLFLVTFPLAMWSISWVVLALALVSTRFRDLPTMVGTALNVLFWLTPIVYAPEQLGRYRGLATLNPLAHMLDIVRLPLLNQLPATNSVLIVIGGGLLGWLATFVLFARFRGRVAFWL